MLTEKQIKILIVVGLFLMEILSDAFTAYIEFVGIGNSSVAIIGGADGPTAIFVAGAERQPEDTQTNTEEELSDGTAFQNKPEPEYGIEENEVERSEADKTNLLILVNKNPVNKNYKPDDLKGIKILCTRPIVGNQISERKRPTHLI